MAQHEPGVPRTQPEVWYSFAALRTSTRGHKDQCACASCRKKLRFLGQLVTIHTPLALRFLGRFLKKWSQFGDIPVEDAKQAALIGLMKAIQGNTTEKGKFAAYVWMWVRLELTKCAESFGVRVKKLPLTAADYRRVVDFEIRNGRLAQPEDLPDIPEKKLRDAQWRARFTSIDTMQSMAESDQRVFFSPADDGRGGSLKECDFAKILTAPDLEEMIDMLREAEAADA